MAPPSLVVPASNRRNTRAAISNAGDDDDPLQQHFPRRFPRTGNAYQCKIGVSTSDSTEYVSRRPIPDLMSVEHPHLSCGEAPTASESPSNAPAASEESKPLSTDSTKDSTASDANMSTAATSMGYETTVTTRGGRLVQPRSKPSNTALQWNASSAQARWHESTAVSTPGSQHPVDATASTTPSRGHESPLSVLHAWALELRVWHQQSLLELTQAEPPPTGRKTNSRYKKRPASATDTARGLPLHPMGPFASLDTTRPRKRHTMDTKHRNGTASRFEATVEHSWMQLQQSDATDSEQSTHYQWEHHRGCPYQAILACLAGWNRGRATRTIRRRQVPPLGATASTEPPTLGATTVQRAHATDAAQSMDLSTWPLWRRDFLEDSTIVVSGDYRHDAHRHPSMAVATTPTTGWNPEDLQATWMAVWACTQACLERSNDQPLLLSSVSHFLLCTSQLPAPVTNVRDIESALERLLQMYAVARQHQAKLMDLCGADNLDLDVVQKQLDSASTVGLEIDERDQLQTQLRRLLAWQTRLETELGRCSTLDDASCHYCELATLETLLVEGRTHGLRCKSLVGLEQKMERAYHLQERVTRWKSTSAGTKETVKFIAALVRDIHRLKIQSPILNDMLSFHQAAESWVERATIAIRSRISLDEIKTLVERGLAMPLDVKEFLEKLQSRVTTAQDWMSSFEAAIPGLQNELRTDKMELIRRIREEFNKSNWHCSMLFELATAGSRIPVEIDLVKLLHVELDARAWTSKAKKWIPSDDANDASRKGKVEDLREHLSKANALRERLTLSSDEREAWTLDGEAQLKAIVQASDDWMDQYESILNSTDDSASYTIEQLRSIVDEGQAIYANLGNGASKIGRILLQAETWFNEYQDLFVRCNLRGTAPPNSFVDLSELKAAASAANTDVSLSLKEVAELLALVRKTEEWAHRTSHATGQKRTTRGKTMTFAYDDLVALIDEAKVLPIHSAADVTLLQEQCRLVKEWQCRASKDLQCIRLSFERLREAIDESYGPASSFRRVVQSETERSTDSSSENEDETDSVSPSDSMDDGIAKLTTDEEMPALDEPTQATTMSTSSALLTDLCDGDSSFVVQIKSFGSPTGIAPSICTPETKIASELKAVERWCLRSIKYLSNNRDVFDKRCFGAFDRFVAEGKTFVRLADSDVGAPIESNGEASSSDQLRTECAKLVSDQLERLSSLQSDRNEFVSWCKKTEAILSAEDRRPSMEKIEILAKKSFEFPDVCDVTKRVRAISRQATAWVDSARKALSSSTKMSVHDAKTLLGKGEEIGFICEEMKTLRNGLKAARSWSIRVKRCKVDRGSEHHSTVQSLMDEHKTLLFDMSDEASKLSSALTNYCLCRRPYEGFMIACDECEDWFHGPCVGVSESRADRVSKYVCLRCLVTKTYKSSATMCIDIVHKWTNKKDLKKHRQTDGSKHKRRVRKETKELEKLKAELAVFRQLLERSKQPSNVSPTVCREVTPTECESLSVIEEKENPISLFPAESSSTLSPLLTTGLSTVDGISNAVGNGSGSLFPSNASTNPESSADSVAAVTETNDAVDDPAEPEPVVEATASESISKEEILSRISIAETAIQGCCSRLDELSIGAAKLKAREDGEDHMSAALRAWVLRLKTLVLVPSTAERAVSSMPKPDGSLSDAMISLDDDARRLGLSDVNDIHSVRNSFKCMGWCLRAMSILARQPNVTEMSSLVDEAAMIELPDEKSIRVIKSLAQRALSWESKVAKVLLPVPGEVRPFNIETLKGLASIGEDIPVCIPLEQRLMTVIDDGGCRHCVCGGPSDGRFMIGCDGCDKWFHGHCVKVSAKDDLKFWKCPSCVGQPVKLMDLQLDSFHDKFDSAVDVDMDDSSSSDVDVSSKAPTPDRLWPPFGLLGSESAREALGKEPCLLADVLEALKIPVPVRQPPSTTGGLGFGLDAQALHVGSTSTGILSSSGAIGFGALPSSVSTVLGYGSQDSVAVSSVSLGFGSQPHSTAESTLSDISSISRPYAAMPELVTREHEVNPSGAVTEMLVDVRASS